MNYRSSCPGVAADTRGRRPTKEPHEGSVNYRSSRSGVAACTAEEPTGRRHPGGLVNYREQPLKALLPARAGTNRDRHDTTKTPVN